MNPIQEVANEINGLAALRDWLGDTGDPVHPMVAEFRAQRCAAGDNGKACPLNHNQGWLETAKGTVASWVRKEMELKTHMELHVTNESRLHVCKACGCYLPLKVWVPTNIVKAHLTDNITKQLPSFCWMTQS